MCAQTTSFGFTELIRFYFHPQLFFPAPGTWPLSQLASSGRGKKEIFLQSSHTPITIQSFKTVFPRPHWRISHLHCAGNKLQVLWHDLCYGLGSIYYVCHLCVWAGTAWSPSPPPKAAASSENLWCCRSKVYHPSHFLNTMPAIEQNTDKRARFFTLCYKKLNFNCSHPRITEWMLISCVCWGEYAGLVLVGMLLGTTCIYFVGLGKAG